MIQKTLFILFNIAFAAAIFLLFAWLNGIQVKADAQNKEYKIGEVIPFDDLEIVVTKVGVTPYVAPPEIPDPYAAFGGFRTREDCKAIIPFQEYADCSQRNAVRSEIMKKLYAYRKHRLVIDYVVKSRTTHTIAHSDVTLTFNTYTKRNVKEPIPITEGVELIPYGESSPVSKNDGKQTDRQLWVDLDPSSEPTATAIFTYKNTTRKVPIEVFALVPKDALIHANHETTVPRS